jgi:uncharacterized damage-inducible protein DinB
MNERSLVPVIIDGWRAYQDFLVDALKPLNEEVLELRAAPRLRSLGEIARHIIGARARWFYLLMGEGGDAFKKMGGWDRLGAKARSAEELTGGLEESWQGMQAAIASWSAEDWDKTWPGKRGEPDIITRQCVIWHLIEHDLHHGGEISLTLGMNGKRALAL